MEYSKELPEQFRTWVEFYDQIKKSGLDDGTYKDVIVEKREKPELYDHWKPKNTSSNYRYEIQEVKNNALEELLSERMKKGDVIRFMQAVQINFQYSGESDWVKEQRSVVKRILLTSALKDR